MINNKKYSKEVWSLSLITAGSLCQSCKDNKILFGKTNWADKVTPLLQYPP
jgi:hypothetical protein